MSVLTEKKKLYFINCTNMPSDGEGVYRVHREGCRFEGMIFNREDLGKFYNEDEALKTASAIHQGWKMKLCQTCNPSWRRKKKETPG